MNDRAGRLSSVFAIALLVAATTSLPAQTPGETTVQPVPGTEVVLALSFVPPGSFLLGSAAEAFNLDHESPRNIERFDTSAMRIGHKVFRKSTLGHQMLLARRLVEAGAGFVTVHSAGWDMHADGNNPGMVKGMNMLGSTLDKSLSAFMDDLTERGLSEKVLLVVTGDFGRTPTINKKGGRDHWYEVAMCFLAGGGMKTGQVVGKSSRNAERAVERPVHLLEVFATMYHNLGIDVRTTTIDDPGGRPQYLTGGRLPIHELIT